MRIRSILAAAALSFAAFSFGGAASASAPTFLCNETDASGCVIQLPITGSTITVGSDGEAAFDPFGYGHDTSDGVQLENIWVGLHTKGWTLIGGTNTWVLPACDGNGVCENGNVSEPVGQWIAPGYTLTVPPITYGIYESDGSLSDVVKLFNDDTGTVNLSFNSSPGVPEPATWALMIGGFGLAGAQLRRRRAAAAAA